MRRTVRTLAASCLVMLLAAGCQPGDNAAGAPAAGQPPRDAQAQPTNGAVAANGDDSSASWCTEARTIGLANLSADAGDPDKTRQILQNIDDLAVSAPTEIHADFAVFDQVEHAVLQPGSDAQPEAGTRVSGSLRHVADYLKNSCHITVESS